MSSLGAEQTTAKADWTDPGYFSGTSRVVNTARILVQLIRPPRGHRTVPTKTGMLLLMITIGVGTAAFNTGQNILYLALSMLLSSLLVSGFLSWLNFKGCRWRIHTGRHFRVGESGTVCIEIENTKRHLPSYSLTYFLKALRSEKQVALALDGRIDPASKRELDWRFIPEMRGVEVLALERMVSRYPFGFLRKSIFESVEKRIIVWPARIPYQFSGDRLGHRWLYGHHRRRGEGVELIQLRDYKSGDSLRQIHWKATARAGSLQVRETEQEHHQAFVFWINPSVNIWIDEAVFEKMCSFAASLAEDLFEKDQIRAAHIMGHLNLSIDSLNDLHAFFDLLGELQPTDHDLVMEGSAPAGAIQFSPGASGMVIAQSEEGIIGQA